MGQYNYFPANSTPEQKFGLTQFVSAIAARIVIIVGHGQGECNNGDLAGCKFSSGWGGWYWIKILADLFGIDLIFINTTLTSKYSLGEYQFALDWIEKNYPERIWGNGGQNIWILGHSLGWYGAGKYAIIDTIRRVAHRITGTIVSASGPYGINPLANLFEIMVQAGLKVWGVTAANDLIMGTNPTQVTQLYTKMKAIDPNAHVIVSEFPATEWPNDGSKVINGVTVYGSKAAHNNVLGRITQKPIGVRANVTKGIIPDKPILMNIAEWMISNPKGSIYQDPTQPFVGPKYENQPAPGPTPTPAPTPSPVYIKAINWAMDKKFCSVGWRDGSPDSILRSVLSDGRVVKNVYDRVVNDRVILTLTFSDGSAPHTIDDKSKWIE